MGWELEHAGVLWFIYVYQEWGSLKGQSASGGFAHRQPFLTAFAGRVTNQAHNQNDDDSYEPAPYFSMLGTPAAEVDLLCRARRFKT